MKIKRLAKILGTVTLVLGIIQIACTSSSRTINSPALKQSKNESAYLNLPPIDYCQVDGNPRAYLSKVIRINGNLSRFQDDFGFVDERCIPQHPIISVKFSKDFVSDVDNETSRKLDQIIHGSSDAREGKIRVIVSAIGLFEELPESERIGEIQYRFIVRRIENKK